jgi:hypothetical protein
VFGERNVRHAEWSHPASRGPEQFTIATAFDRIQVVGDLFAPTGMHRQDLHPALELIRGP